MENKKAAWPKFGKWVHNAQGEPHCSECGAEVKDITPFCAHCGACMGDIDEFGGNDPWIRVGGVSNMEFIANYDAKNVFGCFENVEHHALAFSEETAAKLFDSGMKIFRGDASTLNALKICFTGILTVYIYREIADMDNGVFRVRVWDRPNSYDEKTMSRQALKKMVLFKISQEFAEPAEQSA